MDIGQLAELFAPQFGERRAKLAAGTRLVHYTNAETAYRIISGKEVWLRSANLMNDYSEMRHGLSCLQAAWTSPAGIKLQAWLENCWPGLRDAVSATFDTHVQGLIDSTFLLSLSEHDDDEDQYGRLSMWRAYGAPAGVALILNPHAFVADSEAMKVYSTPVEYRDEAGFVAWFGTWVESLMAAQHKLEAVDRALLQDVIFTTFRMFVLGTKHPGFHEEKEWRVFHSPLLDGPSPWVRYEVEVIRGAPQHVVKVALRNDPDAGIEGADPSMLFDRVIIGPCESPLPIGNALCQALEIAGVSNVSEKVSMSFIPLRQRQ